MARIVKINYHEKDIKIGRESFFSCLFLRSCKSTQSYALKLLEKNALNSPFAVIAKGQRQGVGRGSKKFLSPFNKGVYLTAVFPAENFSNPPLFGALSVLPVIKTVEEFCSLEVQIKWPNDLLLEGKKFCGILPQNKSVRQKGSEVKNYILIGIGVNVNTSEKELSILDIKASSLYLQTKKYFDTKAFALSLLKNFFAFAQNFQQDLEKNISYYISRCTSVGKQVSYLIKDELKQGIITHINRDLSITIQTQNEGFVTLTWGEVAQDL